MTSLPAVVLRAREPVESLKFYVDVLGFPGQAESLTEAHVQMPGLNLLLIRDPNLEATFGSGAERHRVGVGMELRFDVDDPAAIAGRVRERGGFLVRSSEAEAVVRDADGYVLTFRARPRAV